MQLCRTLGRVHEQLLQLDAPSGKREDACQPHRHGAHRAAHTQHAPRAQHRRVCRVLAQRRPVAAGARPKCAGGARA
eukprot:7391338-Prymnesium_polylepis.1